jgi:hypothetical protein
MTLVHQEFGMISGYSGVGVGHVDDDLAQSLCRILAEDFQRISNLKRR